MKTLIVIAALLGVFLAPSLGNDNINIVNQDNIGGDDHQTVNIDNHDNIANINNYNGWNSWDSICDYSRGSFAARFFDKKICVVGKINKASFPSLAQLSEVARDKTRSRAPTPMSYSVSPNKVTDVGQFGKHIQALCKDIPTYTSQEAKDGQFSGFALCKSSSIITILGISFCF
ncbi:gastrokine-1 [Microcaecilia unicolor]|uniref:Gastrokine-1-like n=1 Tax=Microcaecilia unicolor TaxID=1415580 RepID=A0A6P7XYQ8_9AMPH|nr:gastrokine-1-like [Microcaecilia unicolor]